MSSESENAVYGSGLAPYGIVGAMDLEVELLKEAMDGASVETIAGMRYARGSIDGVACVVVQSGVGMVNAALCTQILIDRFGVGCVINTGVAGSLAPEVSVGDVVVATDAVNWIMDVQNLGYAPGQTPGLPSALLPTSESLRKAAVDAAASQVEGSMVHEGRVASGDRFVRDGDERRRIAETFAAVCCEMEGAAIAQVCQANSVPCAIVRAISDNADGSNAGDYEKFEALAARRCALITYSLIARW